MSILFLKLTEIIAVIDLPEMASKNPGELIDEVSREQHITEVAARIAEILPYGPLEIVTNYPGIPGAKYDKGWRWYDPEMTTIGSNDIFVEGSGPNTRVYVDKPELDYPLELGPGHILGADVEHRFGNRLPVHGSSLPATFVLERDDMNYVEWAPRFIEYGRYDRAEAEIHPKYEGVGIVRMYRADTWDPQQGFIEQPTLEEAKTAAEDDKYAVMLISKVGHSGKRAIVTSRLGYSENRPIIVRPPEDEDPIAVEMLDLKSGTTEEEMLEHHINRLQSWGVKGNPSYPGLTPMERDILFQYVTHD